MAHTDSGNLPPSAIEGVPIKEVMIDAICGAGFTSYALTDWALGMRLATESSDQIASWDRTMLGILELDALFAVYGRVKRK